MYRLLIVSSLVALISCRQGEEPVSSVQVDTYNPYFNRGKQSRLCRNCDPQLRQFRDQGLQ